MAATAQGQQPRPRQDFGRTYTHTASTRRVQDPLPEERNQCNQQSNAAYPLHTQTTTTQSHNISTHAHNICLLACRVGQLARETVSSTHGAGTHIGLADAPTVNAPRATASNQASFKTTLTQTSIHTSHSQHVTAAIKWVQTNLRPALGACCQDRSNRVDLVVFNYSRLSSRLWLGHCRTRLMGPSRNHLNDPRRHLKPQTTPLFPHSMHPTALPALLHKAMAWAATEQNAHPCT
jgi:hypothetical protein